jgi:catechol 2,3-dioxygenase-like lactoylglutathione lyase family enzyme
VLRIFDVAKAREFYVDWLGFSINWEHQFDKDMPYYISITRDDIEIHLTEHYGDATPGSKVFITCTNIETFHKEIAAKKYKYYKPAVKEAFYEAWCMDITDPFGNRLSFNEYKK